MAVSPACARTCGLASCSYTAAQASLGAEHSSIAVQLQNRTRAQRGRLSRSRSVQCRASRWQQEDGHVEFPAALSAAGLLAGSALIWLGQSHPALAASMHSSQLPEFHPVAADIQDLASNEDFWSNLARYGRFFITVLLGTAFTAIRPLGGLLKRPVTAVVVVAALFGLYIFLNATLKGMLGVTQEPLTLEF